MGDKIILVQQTGLFETVWLQVDNYGIEGHEEQGYVSDISKATKLKDEADAKEWVNMINEAGSPTFGRVVILTKEEWKRLMKGYK